MVCRSAVKGRELIDDLAELKQREAVDGTQDGMGKAARGFQLQLLIPACAQAGVDGHHDGKRQLGFAMEYGNLLRLAVFKNLEVFLLQRWIQERRRHW